MINYKHLWIAGNQQTSDQNVTGLRPPLDKRHMRPGATKGTLRRENENSFFDVLCLITFRWSFFKKI